MFTLILGGARSGKSGLALRLAAASGRDVLFVATMEAGDEETRARIEAHRAERPALWRTVEAPIEVVAALRAHARRGGFVIVDCVTLWVSNMLIAAGGEADGLDAAVAGFIAWAAAYDGEIAVVSNEVGMGVVPAYPLGRAFRDALGSANQAIAARADRVHYLVAGLALELKSSGAAPPDAFGEARGA